MNRISEASPVASPDCPDQQIAPGAGLATTTCLIRQSFRYEYTGPVHDLRQRLVIAPPERHGPQRLVMHRLEVSKPTSTMNEELDQFGNRVVTLHVDQFEREIEFLAWTVVERDQRQEPARIRQSERESPLYLGSTALTRPDATLIAVAERFARDTANAETTAREINHWLFRHMRYEPGATNTTTSAADAFRGGVGVCQDYAHIMLAICRQCGIPARYVSGHVMGEGSSHAWVEVLLRDERDPENARVLPLDPTHGSEPDVEHVTIAFGRDYNDVAPTSGTFVSASQGSLISHKQAVLTGPGLV